MDSECPLWSCHEALGHSLAHATLAAELGNVGVVIVGGMFDRQTKDVAFKCLLSRSLERACGVPFLPVSALETNPWLQSDTFFNRDLAPDEAERNWIFFAPIIDSHGFRAVWKYYETKVVPGFNMSRSKYYLVRRQRSPDGLFYLLQYPVTGIQQEAFYVLYFKPTVPGENGNFSPPPVEEKTKTSRKPASTSGKESKIPLNQTSTFPALGEPVSGGSIRNEPYATLDNISISPGLVSICRIMGGTDAYVRYMLSKILRRAFTVVARVEADAVSATLSSLLDEVVDTLGITSLPSEDHVSERLRKLEYLEMKDELIKKEEEEEELTRIKDVKSGEEDKVLQEEMTIPTAREAQEQARARVLEQQDDLCKLSHALGVLASVSVEFYNTMVEREDVDGEKAALKAYKAASDQSDEVAEADGVSSELMEKVDGMIQNLEKEIDDDVDIKIGKGWLLLDRDRDRKVTPDEVAAAAMYLKDTLANEEDLQQLISSLSKDKGMVEALMVKVNAWEDESRNMIRWIQPSLVASNTGDISRSTLDKLDTMIENLRGVKLQRMQKVRNFAVSLLQLWSLLDTPAEVKKTFRNVICKFALSESEITEANILYVASIKNVEDEVNSLAKGKTTNVKEVVRKTELEEMPRKMHMAPQLLKSEKLSEQIDSVITKETLSDQIDSVISKVKEEPSTRNEILEEVEKLLSACEQEYDQDDNQYIEGRRAHLTLKLVKNLAGMVEALMVKVNAWEDESRNEFLRLVKKEVEFHNSMVEREDVDGEKAAMKAYKAASDQSGEVAEADEVSSALMEKVDGMIQNLEKEVDGMIQNLEKEVDDDVDIKIGKGWLFLDRDGDGKVTPDEVAAAAMFT